MDKKALSASKTYTDEKLKNYQCGDVTVTKNSDGSITFSANGGNSTATLTVDNLINGTSYVEEITTPSNTWSIQHNLNRPWNELTINIIDSDRNTTNGDIDINSSTNNLLVIKFNEPISGKIYIKK